MERMKDEGSGRIWVRAEYREDEGSLRRYGIQANATADEDGNTSTRNLGLLVARGTLLTSISPVDGSEEIANPFLEEEGGGAGEDGGVIMDGP